MNKMCLALAAVLMATPVAAYEIHDDTPAISGYFVIVGSYPLADAAEAIANADRVTLAARRCGYKQLYMRPSGEMSGMKPGAMVQYTSAYSNRAWAEMILKDVRRCIPDAFIKRGRTKHYEGERIKSENE